MRQFLTRSSHARLLRRMGVLPTVLSVALLATAATPSALHARINKTAAYVAAMKADLRNLVTAQEAYFTDSLRYAASLTDLLPDRYVFSPGVEFVSLSAHAGGFSARMRYPGGTERECWIDVGTRPDGTAYEYDGEPRCDPPPIDQGRVYLAVAYALLMLAALGIRIVRGGNTLPPVGAPVFAGFLLLGVAHPFWAGYRTESYSCLDTFGVEWISVILAAMVALWMARRDDQPPNPSRPA